MSTKADPTITGYQRVAFKPWSAPNFAIPEIGDGVALSLLAPDTLDELAASWLTDLYKKGARSSPWSRK